MLLLNATLSIFMYFKRWLIFPVGDIVLMRITMSAVRLALFGPFQLTACKQGQIETICDELIVFTQHKYYNTYNTFMLTCSVLSIPQSHYYIILGVWRK